MDRERLSILVDENVPYALESFGRFGTVRVLPGRRITAADVQHVDVLIVRSVTRVDEALLAGSPVTFVGTATIGCDHVDVDYLRGRGIAFASAPGSNAISVAEYIVAALLLSARARKTPLEGSTMAVIGVGNVGARVVEKALALGMRCVLNDPPRQRNSGDPAFVALDEALSQAEYVTLHVPLEHAGPDATVGLAGRAFLDKMRPDAVFLNTSRGAVVDEEALAAALDSGRVSHAVLDVWQREPDIDPQMVRRAFLATPHIAGYSFDGKVAATAMLFHALCRWLGAAGPPAFARTLRRAGRTRPTCSDLDLSSLLPPPPVPRVDLRERTENDEDLLHAAVSAIYDIKEDDRALRDVFVNAARDTAGAQFDLLRKTYKQRREFCHTTVLLPGERDALFRKMASLGFRAETH
jgi:erythronate-4-phosphate dehydrogenase